MLQNAYLLEKIGFDTAENEPAKNLYAILIILPTPAEVPARLAALDLEQDERAALQATVDAQQRQLAGLRARHERLLAQAQQQGSRLGLAK